MVLQKKFPFLEDKKDRVVSIADRQLSIEDSIGSVSYICYVVFNAALEENSTDDLIEFSNSISKFSEMNCGVIGIASDSPFAIQTWLSDVVDKLDEGSSPMHCISDSDLQSDLFDFTGGSQHPGVVIVDSVGKVRYAAFFLEKCDVEVKEVLRVVAAIKMVDEANGTQLAPADWKEGMPSITNSAVSRSCWWCKFLEIFSFIHSFII